MAESEQQKGWTQPSRDGSNGQADAMFRSPYFPFSFFFFFFSTQNGDKILGGRIGDTENPEWAMALASASDEGCLFSFYLFFSSFFSSLLWRGVVMRSSERHGGEVWAANTAREGVTTCYLAAQLYESFFGFSGLGVSDSAFSNFSYFFHHFSAASQSGLETRAVTTKVV